MNQSNKITSSRRFLRKMGYTSKYYNRKIFDFSNYEFDIFAKDQEFVAAYVLNKENLLSSLVDLSKTLPILRPNFKMCLFIPSTFNLPMDLLQRISESDIDLFNIRNGDITPIIRSTDKRLIERSKISEIEKTLDSINKICKYKWEISIFKIKKQLISGLSCEAKNKRDFLFQITTISSILESISTKEIRDSIKPRLIKEKELFKRGQSIGIIELFLQKKGKDCLALKKAIKDARDLRDLRNIQPIHSSSSKKIFKKFIGKTPKNDSDWIELSRVSFAKFTGLLILLRNILK